MTLTKYYVTIISYIVYTIIYRSSDNMDKQRGRPKLEHSKNFQFNIRLDEKQVQLLNDCAKKLNCTKTDVILKGIEMISNNNLLKE